MPDVVTPPKPTSQSVIAILLTHEEAHLLAIGDRRVILAVQHAITARLANPPGDMIQSVRSVLTDQERSARWVRLYSLMRDDLNPSA